MNSNSIEFYSIRSKYFQNISKKKIEKYIRIYFLYKMLSHVLISDSLIKSHLWFEKIKKGYKIQKESYLVIIILLGMRREYKYENSYFSCYFIAVSIQHINFIKYKLIKYINLFFI